MGGNSLDSATVQFVCTTLCDHTPLSGGLGFALRPKRFGWANVNCFERHKTHAAFFADIVTRIPAFASMFTNASRLKS